MNSLISSAKGNVKWFLQGYLRRFEAYDLATLLIYKSQGKTWEEYFTTRGSLSTVRDRELRSLYAKENSVAVAERLGDETLRARMKGVSLTEMTPDKASLVRDIFNGWSEERFYNYVSKTLHGRDRDSCLPIIGTSTDLLNLSVVLRSKLIGVKGIADHLVPAYWRLDKKFLSLLGQAEDLGQAMDQAGSVGQYDSVFSGARQKYDESKSLGFLEISVRKLLVDVSRKVLLRFPNSMGVVLAFLVLKENEARNIAAVVSGVGAGLKPDTVRPLLVA